MAKKPFFYVNEPTSPKLDEFDYDVIIVGSGITGLSAAHKILKKDCGITLLIIEGSDKIGGRVAVSGGTRGFFIDERQQHIKYLISKLGLMAINRREIEGEKKRVYYSRTGPIIQSHNMFDEVNGFIDRLDLTAENIELKTYEDYPDAERLARTSLNDLIINCISSSKAQEFIKAIAYTICGNFINNRVEAVSVSALWFIVMGIGAGGLRRRMKFALGNKRRQFIPDGASKVRKKLQSELESGDYKIQTKSVVNLIEFNDVCVYVSVRNGDQYKCEYVIVAVPPPESSKIKILPPKEEVARSQRSHEPGKGTFFLAMYDEPWWLENNYSGDIFGSKDNPSRFRLVYDATYPGLLSGNYLAGFFKGNSPQSGHPLRALRNCWVQTIWGENSTRQYSTDCKSFAEWRWPRENEETGIAEGGYPMTVMRPSHIKNHINPMLMPHKRVYWACSEYARCWPGTLDGAVESGEYAACSILFQLRPQSLNSQELRFITPNTVVRRKNDLPLDLVALRFFTMGIVTAVLIIFCKPVTCARLQKYIENGFQKL
ncbi:amine oxidase [flavin-containing] A isoform X2 [Athalia rosae]|uniref:amine oxidase [flavin-containing] A isoform X2 n=1 Tax=Athalia rosae TaxID=37344 RepID=UPI00203437E9|nr:amine oxidase [flavin-containing] A isoform X2 [Athalia rosae]